ncbi:tripartite tricarboxylate transporter substrate binding protein [Achromobacter mucicolens]|uniref:Bug family tripartite tricarboxylate transporter substrate binding protein n=1 Tax=Achromobacter mucicolens TaxID=1389922 RepID=UPI001D11714F|nr:tripartite tricarboxylate transporter substrate binding protein [Achromobacter mucicolens]WGJ89225.1 tripartite tricarboxylate transporter substrate binding protein [Achromobacter mucicolens]
MMSIIRILSAGALCAVTAAIAAPALAQEPYPCQLVKIISPYPPGGTTDILARLIAPGLAAELGTNVIVENKGGASSNIGTQYVTTAAPDGCTLLLGNNTGVVINRNLYTLRNDPVSTLAPVAEVAAVPLVLYVNASVPARTADELFTLIRSKPGEFNFASGGSGSPQHLMGEMLKLDMKLDMIHIPYRGQGPALADVIAGQVPIAFETTTAIAPQLSSGRIRALATTGTVRSRILPDVPTMKELGHANFVIDNWYGIFAPAKTPAALIQRLNLGVVKALKSPTLAKNLDEMGSDDVAGTPEQFASFIAKELPYWESLVKRTGAKVD